jgi:hypothetical protein
MNVTGVLVSGNATDGWYQNNFTYAVWWDENIQYPDTEGDGGNFYYKVFANNTLGKWSEVDPIRYNGGYDMIEYPNCKLCMFIPIAIVGVVLMVFTLGIVWVRKRT